MENPSVWGNADRRILDLRHTSGGPFQVLSLRGLFHVHDQHLKPVFNIGEADVRIVVQGQDLCVRIKGFQAPGDAAAHDMVRQAAEGLQDDERTAAFLRVVDDLARNQDAFAGIEGMVDDRIAALRQIR